MKLRGVLTDYIKGLSLFQTVTESFTELDETDTWRFDQRNYPLCEVSEDEVSVVQVLGGKTDYHQSRVEVAVSVLINNARRRSKSPTLQARSQTEQRQADTLAESMQEQLDNLTFDTSGVYLQSCQYESTAEEFIPFDDKTIFTKRLIFNCSYNQP